MPRTPKERKITSIELLLGTALIAFVPLYLSRFHAAVEDGGLLLIASVFASDGIFRAIHPDNKKGNAAVFAVVACVVFLGVTVGEYGPIARRYLQQSYAVESFIDNASDTTNLKRLRTDILEERKHRAETVPNDSVLLLVSSLLVDISAILWVEE
ncbi:MAG: hypothetical protein JO061_07665 [Acidobacteriaceae bacterium]|nr:hypothetical protein [Acidobacteriaceae bacterium]